MSGELEIIQSLSVNMECQSVMACHSVQTDKLLCCQSDHQIKHIVGVINAEQGERWGKKSPCSINMAWMHHMLDAFYFFCTQLRYSCPHLHAMLLNHPN